MKSFNWKKFVVRCLISWAIFALVIGFISGFKNHAQEKESIWKYVGVSKGTIADVELELEFYVLKNSLMTSASGNPTLIIRIVYGDLGETVSEVEFDCEKGLMRSYKMGRTLETMVKKDSPVWLKPPVTSAGELILKQSCNKFRE